MEGALLNALDEWAERLGADANTDARAFQLASVEVTVGPVRWQDVDLVTPRSCKEKLESLRQDYHYWKYGQNVILRLGPDSDHPILSKEQVDDYYRRHPRAAEYKTKALRHVQRLRWMFDGVPYANLIARRPEVVDSRNEVMRRWVEKTAASSPSGPYDSEKEAQWWAESIATDW